MPKIALLAVDGDTTWMLYNYLTHHGVVIDYVVLEQPISKWLLIKRRIKKLGITTVFGQLLFQVGIPPLLRRMASKRITEILEAYQCSVEKPKDVTLHQVRSMNEETTLQWLLQHPVDILLVNGTRILSKKLLQQLKTVFINTHLGITPAYRGVHGGFWAMYNNDEEHFGTTIHLVDAGIDTGGILQQIKIKPTEKDNFVTYPYLQMAASLPHMLTLLRQEDLTPRPTPEASPSKLYYHPTLWQYVKAGK